MVSVLRIAKLILFYSIFYTLLLGYTTLIFKFFFTTLNDKQPKWQLSQSLIGDTPGLTFRPLAYDNLIEYKSGDTHFVQVWMEKLNEFLDPYLSTYRSENVEGCYFGQKPTPGKVCDFKIATDFGFCIPQYGYGFDFDGTDKGPCVFLKLNKVFGWAPEFYSSDTAPEEMSVELLYKIKQYEIKNQPQKIWVDCVGVNSSDVENLGPITYYPQSGFNGNYFPFLNIDGYLSPLIAVHFERPQHEVLIRIECRAWAANIRHNRKHNHGIVRFALFVHK